MIFKRLPTKVPLCLADVAFLVSLVWCTVFWPLNTAGANAWTGRVVDGRDRQPMEGAIVVRARVFSVPGYDAKTAITVSTSALTGPDGRFRVANPVDAVGTSAGNWRPTGADERRWVYRPGYEGVPAASGMTDIALEKIPTSIAMRQAELNRFWHIVGSTQPGRIDHPGVRNIVQKEQEFLSGPDESLIGPKPLTISAASRAQPLTMFTPSAVSFQVPPCVCAKSDAASHPDRALPAKGTPPGVTMAMTLKPQPVKPLASGLSNTDLIELLHNDPNALVRSQAAEELGRRRAVEAVPELLKASVRKGSNVSFKASCAISCIGLPALPGLEDAIQQGDVQTLRQIPFILRQFPPEVAQPLLIRLASSPDTQTRKLSLYALAANRTPEVLHLFLTAVDDTEDSIRRLARETLQDLSSADIPALVAATDHRDRRVRIRAMTLLAENFSMHAGDVLVKAMADADGEIQREAVRLARLVDPNDALGVVEAAFARDRELRKAAIPLLERRDIPDGGYRLMQMVDHGDDPTLVPIALKSLCRRDESESLAFIKKYLERNPEEKAYATVLPSLIGSRNPDVIGVVLPALKQDNPKLRKDAILVLAGLATPEGLDIVVAYADDEDPEVRKAVFAALTGAGREALVNIERLMDHKSAYIRWRCARVLGNLPGRRPAESPEDLDPLVPVVIEKLEKSLQDPVPEVRLTAVYSYGVLDRLEGALEMVALLNDPDPGVREETGRHLRNMTGQDFGDSQENWREWIAQHMAEQR